MAWLTVLGPSTEQVEYRLSEQCGCDQTATRERDDDPVLDYRLSEEPSAAITRIGSGWTELGHTAGEALATEADLDTVRSVMAGKDPHSGQQLVRPKRAVDPRAKLAARPLVDAVQAIATAARMSPEALLAHDERAAERYGRLARGLHRDGEAHRAPVRDLTAIAEAAGVGMEVPYDPAELAQAREHADAKVRVGNRGYDLVLNMPKSVSVLHGLADPSMAKYIEELYLRAVNETMAGVESWCAYGVSGHHGGGRSAQRVDGSGLIGSVTLHRSARPVDGQAGDPHIHAHVMIANMIRCSDGKWRTVASGGRDLHRHLQAAGELSKARVRELLSRELGVEWKRCPHSGEWEIVGIDTDVRATFSRRAKQVRNDAGPGASAAEQRARARKSAHAKQSIAQSDLRAAWADRAVQAGIDPARLVREATGRGEGGAQDARPTGPDQGPPDLDTLARLVWDPETGVTATAKITSRAKILSAVANACPTGVSSVEELEHLTERVLSHPMAVRLPKTGASHLSHPERYTSLDIVQAEHDIVNSALRRHDSQAAVVDQRVSSRALEDWCAQKGFTVSREQLAVIVRLVEGGHGLDMVQGVAGSGKTSIMSAARCVWEEAGYRVEGAAVAAVAAEGLRAEAGIASRTVASWKRQIEDGPGLTGVDVLVLDESAMVADRDLAVLVAEAERTGTKLVGIGDAMQLRPVGAGGAFARVHQLVEGRSLTENRRQRDEIDRTALRTWREGGRRSALALWAEHGMVHAPADLDLAYGQMAAAWWSDRSRHTDPHQAIEQVLMLATTNDAVDELNSRARSIARSQNVLGEDVHFRARGGREVVMAPGDQVRVTKNDYRGRDGSKSPDVLNGYRGVVLQAHARKGVLIQWRSSDGHHQRAWMSPEQVARGDLKHAYAITIAAAQGLTSERCHVLGYGADAHSLYPAMSRARGRTDLYLPAAELEPEEVRLRLGEARDAEEGLRRVVNAYASTLTDTPEGMVIDELDEAIPAPSENTPRSEPEHERLASKSKALARRAHELESDLPSLRAQVRRSGERLARGRAKLLLEGTTLAQAREEARSARDRYRVASETVHDLRAEASSLASQAERERLAHEQRYRLRRLEQMALEYGLTRTEVWNLPEERLRSLKAGYGAGSSDLRSRPRPGKLTTAPDAPPKTPRQASPRTSRSREGGPTAGL